MKKFYEMLLRKKEFPLDIQKIRNFRIILALLQLFLCF